MKSISKNTIIISVSTLIVGFITGWLIFGSNPKDIHDDHEHVKTEVNGQTIWTCSMHPQIRQTEPGDCPICGMDLIPLEDDKHAEVDPTAISMSSTAMQLANVSTALVGMAKPVKEISLYGKIQADERLIFTQPAHIPGRIEDLLIDFTGEFVKKGQVIAHVYSPELVTAQKELFEAQKIANSQPDLFEAAKEKLLNWRLSKTQIDEILKSGEVKEVFPIISDLNGYLVAKKVNEGDYVKKGQPLFEIADLSKIWVLFDVYESDMSWIKLGDKVDFTIASLPGEKFTGQISYIDPIIDPKTRVSKARVEMKNNSGKLKPEMFATGVVKAQIPSKQNSLVVPKSAVMWTGKRSVVYVKTVSDQGVYFNMREVTLGEMLGDSYIIEDGLMEGEEIAVSGTFSIDAAAQLAGKPSMMNPEGGKVMTGHNHAGMNMNESEPGNEAMNEPIKNPPKHVTIDNRAKRALEPLFSNYLKWKDALTNDDFKLAQQMAKKMKSTLSSIDMNIFKDDAHVLWMDYSKGLNASLEHVEHYSDIEQLRKSFMKASAIMIKMVETFKPVNQVIYIQHCPMANNNNGADWLSTDKEIKNPYFGSSMLTCGEVTKEVK